MYLTKLWYLKNIDVFKCIQEKHVERSMYFSGMCAVKRYEDISFPEQGLNHVYIIQEGHVKLSRLDGEGHQIVLDVLSPGELFGELALEGDEKPNEFAEAADNVTVCVISKRNFETLLEQVPELQFRLTTQIGSHLHEFEENITDLVFKDAAKRIIGFLARYGQVSDRSQKYPITIITPMSYQEIASLTGTSPPTVAKVVNELQDKKLIEFTNQSLVFFYDLESLRTLAQ